MKQGFRGRFLGPIRQSASETKVTIKAMETQLAYWFEQGEQFRQGDIVQLVDKLAKAYARYRRELYPMEPEVQIVLPSLNGVRACYQALEDCKEQWLKSRYSSQKTHYLDLIAGHYQYLFLLLSQELAEQGLSANTESADDFQRSFDAVTVHNFLQVLVDYWNNSTLETFARGDFLKACTREQLQCWNHRFSDPDYIQLFNMIFYYKLHPQTLYDARLHPEKLISIQARLDFLYQFIENIQEQVHFLNRHYGLPHPVDYLLHGEEFPQGLGFQVNKAYQLNLIQAVEILNNKGYKETEGIDLHEKIQDLLRAYKFWFNPNRLVDTVMILYQQLGSQDDDFLIFQQKMAELMRQLNTIECLDLYGYFANKDSTYLLRTLWALSQGEPVSNISGLTVSEKETVACVYAALKHTLWALRDELERRHMRSEAYPFEMVREEKLCPGQRIITAVQRLLFLYVREKTTNNNATLEKLFNLLETAGSE